MTAGSGGRSNLAPTGVHSQSTAAPAGGGGIDLGSLTEAAAIVIAMGMVLTAVARGCHVFVTWLMRSCGYRWLI